MDTGSYMANQMDNLIESGIKLHEELMGDAEDTYKVCQKMPSELLRERNELLNSLRAINGMQAWINDGEMKTLFTEKVSMILKKY